MKRVFEVALVSVASIAMYAGISIVGSVACSRDHKTDQSVTIVDLDASSDSVSLSDASSDVNLPADSTLSTDATLSTDTSPAVDTGLATDSTPAK